MKVTFRPIDEWPREETEERLPSPYTVGWGETLVLLKGELAKLGAEHVVVQLALKENRIRSDGWPRADARPTDPRVIVSFQHPRQGWVSYPADLYDDWEGNMRAIALTLHDLRLAGQRGVLRMGEQYVGSLLELEAGALGIEGEAGEGSAYAASAMPAAPRRMTREEAARFLSDHGGIVVSATGTSPSAVGRAYRRAAAKLHPDAGGDPEEFRRLQEARDVLLGGGS